MPQLLLASLLLLASAYTTAADAGDFPGVKGLMSAEEYDEFVRDTTNFLAFIAEPIRQDRRTLGVWVLIFLVFFLILAAQLKKEIWKDVK